MLNAIICKKQTQLSFCSAKLHYMPETFKQRMKRLRLRAGLTSQGAAAAAIGCVRGTVCMWEAPSSPVDSVGGEYLPAVARAYKVRPDYLNTGVGEDGFPWEGYDAPAQVSAPGALDPEVLAETIRSLREMNEDQRLGLDLLGLLENEPERFIQAYELYRDHTHAKRSAHEERMLGMKLAYLSQEFASNGKVGNVRGTPVPAEGIVERSVGTKGKRKR